jgi:dihydrolipoamide dehydrogenase
VSRIVVLGGGPAGYIAALRVAHLGGEATLVESREIGGTCLNRGCIPTKSMVASVDRLRAARDSAAYGVVVASAGVDFAALMRRKGAATAQLREGVEKLLGQRKVEVVAGRGTLLGPGRVGVAAGEGPPTREIEGDAVILATGSEPMRLPIFDFSDPLVMTSDELLAIESVPERLVVVGGGVIGCEFATVFAELGSTVTVVEMLDQLLPGEERRVGVALLQAFKRAGITAKLKTRVEEVTASDPGGVTLRLSDGAEVAGDVVLVSVAGRSRAAWASKRRVSRSTRAAS